MKQCSLKEAAARPRSAGSCEISRCSARRQSAVRGGQCSSHQVCCARAPLFISCLRPCIAVHAAQQQACALVPCRFRDIVHHLKGMASALRPQRKRPSGALGTQGSDASSATQVGHFGSTGGPATCRYVRWALRSSVCSVATQLEQDPCHFAVLYSFVLDLPSGQTRACLAASAEVWAVSTITHPLKCGQQCAAAGVREDWQVSWPAGNLL